MINPHFTPLPSTIRQGSHCQRSGGNNDDSSSSGGGGGADGDIDTQEMYDQLVAMKKYNAATGMLSQLYLGTSSYSLPLLLLPLPYETKKQQNEAIGLLLLSFLILIGLCLFLLINAHRSSFSSPSSHLYTGEMDMQLYSTFDPYNPKASPFDVQNDCAEKFSVVKRIPDVSSSSSSSKLKHSCIGSSHLLVAIHHLVVTVVVCERY